MELTPKTAGKRSQDSWAGMIPVRPGMLADRWQQELDRNQVGRAALIASFPGDEESVAAAIARHPNRFVGFFMVDPTQADTSERVSRALSELGLRCACLFPGMHHYDLSAEATRQLFETVASPPGFCRLRSLWRSDSGGEEEAGSAQPVRPEAVQPDTFAPHSWSVPPSFP